MKACPYRADFFTKLRADQEGGEPVTQEELETDLNKWLAALSAIVQHMQDFYVEGNYDKGFWWGLSKGYLCVRNKEIDHDIRVLSVDDVHHVL